MRDDIGLRIKVSGYQARAADAAQKLIDDLIDIAGVDWVGPDYILVKADDASDLEDAEKYEWIKGLIDAALSRHWIYATFELITLPPDDDDSK